MNFRFQADAKEDLFTAAAYYEHRQVGLGFQFRLAVDEAIERLLQDPESYPAYLAGTRMIPVKKFPYQIVFLVFNETVEIFAVAHHSQRPGYWTLRLQDFGSEE